MHVPCCCAVFCFCVFRTSMASLFLRPAINTALRTTAPRTTLLRPQLLAPSLASQPHPRSFRTSAAMSTEAQEIRDSAAPEWKKRAPYRIHEKNEGFKALYDASCHCGRVKYQLSREKPLESKLCHCTTCQTQHGESPTPEETIPQPQGSGRKAWASGEGGTCQR